MAPKTLNLNTQTVLAATAVGAITILAMYWYHKKRKTEIPAVWEPVGSVKNLYIYPLKSGHRMEIQTGQCTKFGFKLSANSAPYMRDRCLVVYKESNKEFKTARTYPKMLLICVTADDHNHFTVTAPGMEKLKIKVPSLNENCKTDEVSMWENEKVFTLDCGDEAAHWFSRYILGNAHGLRLGFHDGVQRRDIKKTHKEVLKVYTKLGNESTGMYSDLASYMLMNQSSVDELTSRIYDAKINMNHFRPNIVVEGKTISPYSEDNWDWIKIGQVVFRNVKPCTRCSMTTINPETAVKCANNEPIKTLKKYRKLTNPAQIKIDGDSPVLGINLGLEYAGEISVGDTVYLGKK